MMKKEKYGARLNPLDPRDYPVSDLIDAASLPHAPTQTHVDYSGLLGQVHYQGGVPSCTAFATAHQIYLFEQINKYPRISFPSPAFIYSGTRYWTQSLGGKQWRDGDKLIFEGTYPRAAYQWVSKMGTCAEDLWPYSERKSNLNKLPDRKQLKGARGRKGLSYYTVDTARFENVMLMLDQGFPPTLTVSVTPQWYGANSEDELVWKNGTEEVEGYHRVCAIGYKDGFIKVANSWKGVEYLWLNEDWIEQDAADITVVTRMK